MTRPVPLSWHTSALWPGPSSENIQLQVGGPHRGCRHYCHDTKSGPGGMPTVAMGPDPMHGAAVCPPPPKEVPHYHMAFGFNDTLALLQ